MSSNTEHLRKLIEAYFKNTVSKEEHKELWELLREDFDEQLLEVELKKLWDNTNSPQFAMEQEEWNKKLQNHKQQKDKFIKVRGGRKKAILIGLAVAASLIFIYITRVFYFVQPQPVQSRLQAKMLDIDSVTPDRNEALYLLPDTNPVQLNLTAYNEINSHKLDSLVSGNDNLYNTVTTPLGKNMTIILPDSSIVQLNALSAFQFPKVFSQDTRTVYLRGEGYFEVAGNRNKPFIVQCKGQWIKVLGTKFIINNYKEEGIVKTTLLEGSIVIYTPIDSLTLKPGQQAINKNGKLTLVLKEREVEKASAFKENKFLFDDEDIKGVMNQLSRWYDIEVEYRGDIKNRFGGMIGRSENIKTTLNILEATGGAKFEMEGKKVIVKP